MRRFLAVLVLLSWLVASVPAAESGKPINTICPVTGKPVDPAVAPVIITMGKGERAQRFIIAVADSASAEKVKANPEMYMAAARSNKQVEAH